MVHERYHCVQLHNVGMPCVCDHAKQSMPWHRPVLLLVQCYQLQWSAHAYTHAWVHGLPTPLCTGMHCNGQCWQLQLFLFICLAILISSSQLQLVIRQSIFGSAFCMAEGVHMYVPLLSLQLASYRDPSDSQQSIIACPYSKAIPLLLWLQWNVVHAHVYPHL